MIIEPIPTIPVSTRISRYEVLEDLARKRVSRNSLGYEKTFIEEFWDDERFWYDKNVWGS